MIFDVINKLKLVDKYIYARKTGTRCEFAKLVGISKSQLYYYLDFLKEKGAEIGYNRKCQTYYYKNIVEVDVNLSVRVLYDDELMNSNAGFSICLWDYVNNNIFLEKYRSVQ